MPKAILQLPLNRNDLALQVSIMVNVGPEPQIETITTEIKDYLFCLFFSSITIAQQTVLIVLFTGLPEISEKWWISRPNKMTCLSLKVHLLYSVPLLQLSKYFINNYLHFSCFINLLQTSYSNETYLKAIQKIQINY